MKTLLITRIVTCITARDYEISVGHLPDDILLDYFEYGFKRRLKDVSVFIPPDWHFL